MLVVVTLIFSFFLESILSNIIPINSIFICCFCISSLIIIYPFFTKDDYSFYKYAFILGLFYDIVFTDLILLNAFIFLSISSIIKLINIWLSNNFINVAFMSFLIISLYRILTFVMLLIIGYLPFDLNGLFISIYSSLISNIIYVVIMYIILDKISKKYHILKID